MTLADFRALTAHLEGERELRCAGVPVNILWHEEGDIVSFDDGPPDLPADAIVLYNDGDQ